MPLIKREGDLFTVNYITGPTHNWLGLSLSKSPVVDPIVVTRPTIGQGEHEPLDSKQIVSAFFDGLEHSGLGFYANRIEYVVDDTPRYDVYRYCALLLARFAAELRD